MSGAVGVHDSKAPDLGYLSLSPESFAQFVKRVRADELSI
ncbi:DUF397 domain-containing protein [Actinomadura rubrisoli]|uniref:DUF397 domain-containing protein n=1 Tax=Actinomadura rubrisoli TaxID=2530368 RepID=A0A4R5BX19_9ACTN|nr:DUF397 domain-containing protein [Actinomadura rubrisoli]